MNVGRTAGLALAVVAALHVDSSGAAGSTNVRRVSLLSEVPQAVSDGQARLVGALPGTQHLKLAINLTLNNQAQLTQFLQQLSDPTSPSYRQYLTADQFTEQYGPSQADYDAVVAWAQAQGLNVTGTSRNRHIVDVEGSVDTINRALGVTMSVYRHPSEPRTFFAPDQQPSIALAVPVLQITGLDDMTPPQRKLRHGTPDQIARATANSTGSGPGGLFLPSDMRAAYYGSGPLNGAGQTIGILSFDGLLISDVGAFYQLLNITTPPRVPLRTVLVNGYNGLCNGGGPSCDDGEQVLDIVNSVGMAPGANEVVFYEGASGPDILNQMASDNLAKVLSSSWGSSDMGTVCDPIYQEFQAQGQTFLNASGDSGAYDARTWLPPSANPLVLEVGATDLTTNGAGGTWASETAWTDSSGGFYAPAGYSIPSYQTAAGVITVANGGSTSYRNDPDVAAEGNFDNPTVINGQLATGYGGTSFAAPRWAGMVALANEQAQANGSAAVGFVNPRIYTLATGARYGSDFHDVTSGKNPAHDNPSLFYNAVTGFDLVTGWGSPQGASLIADLGGATASSFVIGAYPTNPSLTQGSTVTTTVTVTDLGSFTGSVNLSVSGLPASVTASFGTSPTTSTSVLTFRSTAAAAAGKTTPVTITATSGAQTRTTTVNLFVGNAPTATVMPQVLNLSTVAPAPAFADQPITLANGSNSIPLTYSAFAAADATCTRGSAPTWLTSAISSTEVDAGQATAIDVAATPSTAGLGVGSYAAALCVSTNDPANAQIVIPVNLAVVPGPRHDVIFQNGFDDAQTGAGLSIDTIDQSVTPTIAGSSLDLGLGWYHAFSSSILDNINLYSDGSGLSVYWYDDVLSQNGSSFASQVGGVVDASKNLVVLQHGAVIGPSSTFANSTVNPGNAEMTNWWGGVDGYIGIAFLNSQTSTLNYGYIHVKAASPAGFPAQVLDYGFDATGAAVTIP